MNFDLTNIFQIDFLIKSVSAIIVVMYIVFSFVIFTQVNTMNKIINLPVSSFVLKLLSIMNIIAGISLLFLLLAIL